MAVILKVTAEQLLESASVLSEEGASLKSLTDQMSELVRQISADVWSGEAQTAFLTRFTGLADDMERIHHMVREHVTDLQEIARNFQRAETQNQELSGALASDVIV